MKQLKGPGGTNTPPPSAHPVVPPQAPPPAIINPAAPGPINAPPPVINVPPNAAPPAPARFPAFHQPAAAPLQPLGGGAPVNQQVDEMRRMLQQMQQQQMQDQQRPLAMPTPGQINIPNSATPFAVAPSFTAPGVASISAPLAQGGQAPAGFMPGIPPPVAVNMIAANPLPEPTLPGGSNGGSRSVLPNYSGFKFSGPNAGTAPILHIKPP